MSITVFLILAEEKRLEKGEPPSEQAGDETDEQSGDDRPFSDPVQAMGEEERKDCRDDGQLHVKSDLCGAELCLPCRRYCADKRLAGQHRHIGKDFRVYAESQDHAPDQQVDHG